MRYLAEFYQPSHDPGLLTRMIRAAGSDAAGPHAAQASPVLAMYAEEDENCLVMFDAPSAEAVRAVGTLAGIEFDHIVAVTTVAVRLTTT